MAASSPPTNDLSVLIPQILAQGQMALREMAVMPLLVNRGYDTTAGNRGSVIEIPIPTELGDADTVVPGYEPTNARALEPTVVNLPLDQWKEKQFTLSDKEKLEVMEGVLPMSASEALRSLANTVDKAILGLYPEFYGFIGTPGTTPFGAGVELKDVTGARAVLHKQLAPPNERRIVVDPDAEANALNIRAFHDASFGNSVMPLLAGQMDPKFGFNFFMDQNMLTHTAGSAADAADVSVNGAHLAGVNTISVDKGAGTATLVRGDIITIAGHTQTYAIVADVNLSATAAAVTISPALAADVADNAVITTKDDHVVNLAFHRDAIAFASRPFRDDDARQLGSIIETSVDPITKLALRLEVKRYHRLTTYAWDILFGTQVVRPQLGMRIAG